MILILYLGVCCLLLLKAFKLIKACPDTLKTNKNQRGILFKLTVKYETGENKTSRNFCGIPVSVHRILSAYISLKTYELTEAKDTSKKRNKQTYFDFAHDK